VSPNASLMQELERFTALFLLVVEVTSHAESKKKKKTGAATVSGTGRPRGRPKKIVVDKPKQASLSQQERRVSGLLLLFLYD